MFRRLAFGLLVSLTIPCSCTSLKHENHAPNSATVRTGDAASPATAPHISTGPACLAELLMNDGAGRGDFVIVMLQMERSTVELPFIVDTGAPGTLFDKSLEAKLTRLPLGTWTIQTFNERQHSAVYVQPKLYLGGAALMTGHFAATFDTTKLSAAAGRPIMGILGMDCLKHYRLQLDFQRRKLRFLDGSQRGGASWGKPFALAFSFPGGQPSISHAGLAGGKASQIEADTGFNLDGEVESGVIDGQRAGVAHLSNCVWDGDTYRDLTVGIRQGANRLGLRFLARHLVTLDFPNRVMYLKQQSVGPLLSDGEQAEGDAAAGSAVRFLKGLLSSGRLPGWSPDDQVATKELSFHIDFPNAATCDQLLKKGDNSVYHYKLIRESKERPWKLQKAWRTDEMGRIVEDYAVP